MPKPYKGNWSQSPASLKQRPILAAYVGSIAALSTVLDATIGRLFGHLLGVDSEIATAMYLAIIAENPRSQAMNAVLKVKLTAERIKEFQDVIDSTKGPRKERNKVVHGLWAIPESNPDSIVLLDIGAFLRHNALMDARRAGAEYDVPKAEKSYNELFGSFMEYEEADFVAIETRLKEAFQRVADLMFKIDKEQFDALMAKSPK